MKKKILAVGVLSFFAACAQPAAPPAQSSQPVSSQPVVTQTAAMLLPPSQATERAPDVYKVRFQTTKGDFILEVQRAWAPVGADRFYNLVKMGYFDEIAFFRAISGFMVQFGIHGSPEVSAQWRNANIPDDPPAGQSNSRGAISFATAGPNTRTTQVFINYGNNAMLDGMGFTPFGHVVEGMDVVANLYQGYGEGAPQGLGPDQGRVQAEGNAYLKRDFPQLDYVKTARLILDAK